MSATQMGGVPATGAASDLTLVLPGRGLPAGDGWTWIAQGWRLFARSPVMWLVALLLLFIICVALAFVPFLGHIVLQVLGLERIYINGGRRGFLLGMDPAELTRVLTPVLVDVAIEE